jgi:signal transduction histidine kinase
MQERANAIGARLSIESEPFVGTLVECRLETTA